MKHTMGAKLKEIRVLAEVTQQELAEKMGYGNPQFVSNWERGACRMPLSKALVFSKTTRVRPEIIRDIFLEEAKKEIDSALRIVRKKP